MSQVNPPNPFKDLEDRLARARSGLRPKEGKGPILKASDSGLGLAFRLGVEMVASLALGVGIGWLLDRWLDTAPWLMVVFFFLGSGAGIMNVYRAASGIGMAPGYRRPDEDGSNGAPDDGAGEN